MCSHKSVETRSTNLLHVRLHATATSLLEEGVAKTIQLLDSHNFSGIFDFQITLPYLTHNDHLTYSRRPTYLHMERSAHQNETGNQSSSDQYKDQAEKKRNMMH